MKVLNCKFKIEKDTMDKTADEILKSSYEEQIDWVVQQYKMLFIKETPDKWTSSNMSEYPVEVYLPNTLIAKFRDMESYFREHASELDRVHIHRTVLTAVITDLLVRGLYQFAAEELERRGLNNVKNAN